MSSTRVRAVLAKELAEIRRNKLIVISMAILPLIMVGMTLVTAYLLLEQPAAEAVKSGFRPPPALLHLERREALLVLLNDQYMFYLLMMPMILPVTIAAYSIIGEKETRSLEPLLATPITTGELLVAKAVAAAGPAAVLGWLSYVVTIIGMAFIAPAPVVAALVRPVWSVGMLLLSPLLALFATQIGLLVSARTKDVRAAQSVAALTVLPLVGGAIAIVAGNVYLELPFLVLAVGGALVANAFMLWLTARLFQREQILTRWK